MGSTPSCFFIDSILEAMVSSISLAVVSERFKEWRKSRKGRKKIPEELGELLTKATAALPVSMVAKVAWSCPVKT